jgi:hypothetical protein
MNTKSAEIKQDVIILTANPQAQPQAVVQSCCGASEQATCCDASEKASCCGSTASTGTCGCK